MKHHTPIRSLTALCPLIARLLLPVSLLSACTKQTSTAPPQPLLANADLSKAGQPERESDGDKSGYTDPGGALHFRRLQLQDETGRIPLDGLMKAREHVARMKAAQAERQGGNQGLDAAGIDPGSWTWLGPGNIGGRIRTIVIHPTAPNTMWLGSVGGGIWRTDNGGNSWAPVNDFMANLATSSLVIDPTNPNNMYAGTGEGFGNVDALAGAGIFKSTDGGVIWLQLASTNPAAPNPPGCGLNNTPCSAFWQFVNRVAISLDGTVLLAATNGGIARSINGGMTWSQRTNTVAADVKFPGGPIVRAVAGGLGQAQYSSDGGATWAAATFNPPISNGGTSATDGRVELATHKAFAFSGFVYASVNQNNGEVFRSNDGGQSYTRYSTGVNYLTNSAGNQGWYDNTIWSNPNDPDDLIVGGIFLWRGKIDFGTGTIPLMQISDGTDSPHADNHVIVEHPGWDFFGSNRTLFIGNDGGIFRASDLSSAGMNSGWTELNNTLGITQFYGATVQNTSGVVIAGAQDNGTQRFTGDSENWTEMFHSDGGAVAADQTDPMYLYGERQNLQVVRSTDGGASADYIFTGIGDTCPNLPPMPPPPPCTPQTNFIAPLALDPIDPNTLLAGGWSLWRSNDAKATTPTWAQIKGPSGNQPISAIGISPITSSLILVGHNNGQVFRTLDGTSLTPTWTNVSAGLPAGRMVTRLVIDPNHATNWYYVTFGGFNADNIYRSTNNGGSWIAVTGTGANALPPAPVRTLAVNPINPRFLYAGTEVGIFTSEDAGATWQLPQDGPANVSVDEVFFDSQERLYAATHGRGVYRTNGSVLVPPQVTSASDSGPGSLRDAIMQTVLVTGTDRKILFNIPGNGVQTINLSSTLPFITVPMTIDGWSQGGTGYMGPPLIELNGASTGLNASGLILTGGNSTVRGLIINRFSGSGIVLQNGGDNKVHGCYIGTDAAGTVALGNGANGILIDNSPSNEIGTPTTPSNVISGNAVGVRISGGAATLNHLENNRIGTNASGTARVPNLSDGVQIADAPGNFVGNGTGNLAINVISGNGANNAGADGIEISGAGATGNKIYNNFIGLNASGTAALENQGSGVRIANAPNTEIGFANPSNRNIIAGSSNQGGIALIGSGSSGTIIRGNYLGTDVTGMVAITNNATDIHVESGNNVIGGTTPSARNVISGFHSTTGRSGRGIYLFFAGGGNVIQGNYIGTNAAGTAALSDFGTGIDIRDTNNVTVGGSSAAERNIISGNQEGINIAIGAVGGPGNVRVQGNYIGTNPAGNAALPNRFMGIRVDNSMNNLIIGGTEPGAGNVIAADGTSGGSGIRMSSSTGSVIQGNRIGTNAAGTSALGNSTGGIEIYNSTNNLIGGTTSAARNIISANGVNGIKLSANGNTVLGNYIGTDVNGTADFGNGRLFGSAGIDVSGTNNVIGGTAAGQGNIIAFNGCPVGCGNPVGTGLRVDFGTGNSIRGNSIFSNAEIGIDLVGGSQNSFRVTSNDSCDADTGPNNLQNYPVLTSAQSAGGSTTIAGTLNSAAATAFQIDFYANTTCDISNNGEGRTYLGSVTATTDGSCSASFQAVLSAVLQTGQVVTATATDPAGNTSEFSACRVADVAPSISGTISYCSKPVPGPVPNVTLTLTGTSGGSTLSDGSGNYTFAGLASGGSFTVTPTKSALAPTSTGITGVDAVAVQRHFLILGTPLSGCRLTAADVTGTNGVDGVDAIAIQRFFLGFTTGIANTGKYQFTPANRSYSGIVTDQTAQNYDTLVFGDTASSFVELPDGPERTLTDDGTSADQLPALGATLSLPSIAVDPFVTNFIVQVTTATLNSSDKLVGFQGDFTFDERVVTFESEPVQKAGLTGGNWNVSGNVLPGVGPIRTLRISAYSNDFTALSGSGTLFELRMTRESKAALSTQLIWAAPPNQFIFIDADLKTQKPGYAASGSVSSLVKRK